MERFIKGDIVVVPFPFSDLTNSKKRPALVLADLIGNDIILCQITSKKVKDSYSVQVIDNDFSSGSLHQKSNIRPNRIFTADKNIIIKKVGKIKQRKFEEVSQIICDLIS